MKQAAVKDDYAEKIKSSIKEKDIDNLILTGYRSDIPELLAALDIFVFPSHAESFGMALIEAMSMKKASVCSSAEGVLDIAVDGETSYLFQKQNSVELTQEIKILVKDSALRNKFAEASSRTCA